MSVHSYHISCLLRSTHYLKLRHHRHCFTVVSPKLHFLLRLSTAPSTAHVCSQYDVAPTAMRDKPSSWTKPLVRVRSRLANRSSLRCQRFNSHFSNYFLSLVLLLHHFFVNIRFQQLLYYNRHFSSQYCLHSCRSRPSSWQQTKMPPSNSNVRHLTCWYWANGHCIYPDDICLYAHYRTGTYAEEPRAREPGGKFFWLSGTDSGTR